MGGGGLMATMYVPGTSHGRGRGGGGYKTLQKSIKNIQCCKIVYAQTKCDS